MHRRTRKIYFWSLFISFFVLTPLIILYTSGYRIDWNNTNLVRTGSLYLKTQPRQAEIFIDDELYENQTPILINNLLPNEYQINLKKEGYHEWQKKLKVDTQQTTFANQVILFKKAVPQLIDKYPVDILNKNKGEVRIDFGMEVTGYTMDENQEQLLYYNDFELWTYQIKDQYKTLITRQSQTINDAFWHPLGNYIIYADTQSIKAIELDARDYRQIQELATVKASNLTMDEKGQYLYFVVEDKKYQLELY